MALELKLRNRIVGLLVIASAILIALPALINHDEESNKDETIKKENINQNTFATSTNEKDYTQLLTDNNTQSLDINNDALVLDKSIHDSVNNDNPFAVEPQKNISTTTQNTTNVNKKTEVLQSQTPAKKTEVLVANKTPNKETLTTKGPNRVTKDDQFASYTQIKGKFSVQVGTYSKQTSAKNMAGKLQSAGISSYFQTISKNGNDLIRVYAGSSSNKDDLKAIKDKVQKVTGTLGIIVKVQ